MLLLCGILSPAVYIGGDILAARRYPGYSAADQVVSELFAIGAPTSRLVVALFSLSSALLLAFAIGIWWAAGRRRALRVMAVMLVLDAIDALVLWNAFPMHMRGTAPTLTDAMHVVFAVNPFVLASLVAGAVAFHGGFRRYTIATIVLLVALAVYGFSFVPAVAANAPTPWMGLSERIAQYGVGLWQAAMAVTLWRRRAAPPTA